MLNSCEMPGISREYTYRVSLSVNEAGSEFNEQQLLCASTGEDDLQKFSDRIESIRITRIAYTVNAFEGDTAQMINVAILQIADTMGQGASVMGVAANEYLHALVGTEKELPLDPSGIQRFEELYLYSPHAARFYFHGNANAAPLDFTILFTVTVKVTGTIL